MEDAERKIIRVGNSLGTTIPAELLAQAGLKQGDEVGLQVVDGAIRLVKNRKVVLPEGISEDFFDVLNETVVDYNKTIRGLADR